MKTEQEILSELKAKADRRGVSVKKYARTGYQLSVEEYVSASSLCELLNACIQQVQTDPKAVASNPHLYDQLHHIYLRLCHGNIPDHTSGG